jgi:hypothetical protein
MPGLDRDLPGRRLGDDHSRLNQANESGLNKPEGRVRDRPVKSDPRSVLRSNR